MKYEVNSEDQEIEDVFLIGNHTLGITKTGEIWMIGGEDFSPKSNSAFDEQIIDTSNNSFDSHTVHAPVCTGIMKLSNLKALKVVPFGEHKKLVLTESPSGHRQVCLNSGEMNRELSPLPGIGLGDIVDFSIGSFERKIQEEESKSETQKLTCIHLLVDSSEQKK
jgi:hypothetical protein